jgi:flagellar motility protein MotE (MotC chaperone)
MRLADRVYARRSSWEGSSLNLEDTMKNFETKPLKNWEKHQDGLLELLIANKAKKVELKKLEPSKSYKKVA